MSNWQLYRICLFQRQSPKPDLAENVSPSRNNKSEAVLISTAHMWKVHTEQHESPALDEVDFYGEIPLRSTLPPSFRFGNYWLEVMASFSLMYLSSLLMIFQYYVILFPMICPGVSFSNVSRGSLIEQRIDVVATPLVAPETLPSDPPPYSSLS